MKKLLTLSFCLSLSLQLFAQKKVLDHADFDIWNSIENETISRDGNYIMYSLERGEEDNFLEIRNLQGDLVFTHERGYDGEFTFDSQFAIFTIKAWEEDIRELKRAKTKKEDMPKDTLAIYHLNSEELVKIPMVSSYQIPKKWAGVLAYQLDSEAVPYEEKEEKPGKENGYHTIIRNLNSGDQDSLKYVMKYAFAEEGEVITYVLSDKAEQGAGVYVYELSIGDPLQIFSAEKAKYPQMNISKSGGRIAFVADLDTTKALIRPNELYTWSKGMNRAEKVVDETSAPDGYLVSADGRISFSKDETKLFFGLATPPILQDTSLLEEEIVNVEVWTYDEPRLYTVQEMQVENDLKRSFLSVIHLDEGNKLVQLETTELPNAELGNEGNADFALANTSLPYELQGQWEGGLYRDYFIVNVSNGEVKPAFEKVRGRVSLSPAGNYAYGYSSADSTWFTFNISNGSRVDLTKGEVFFDELNDSPNFPSAYGSAGWTEGDNALLIYDRYDIWKFDPDSGEGLRLTEGRKKTLAYRYVKLDDEARFISEEEPWLLSTFNEKNKYGGFSEYNPKSGSINQLIEGPYSFGRPRMAQASDEIMLTRESFEEFPNIHATDMSFSNLTQVSDANPQQSEYNWGTAELVNWISLDGKELQGMLIKPENFDPNKKYPMIVNFYEKSSDGLFSHRPPTAGRSTISYSFYTSRGYVIFNPDVHYRIGYPGESAYNSVIPGITSLIEEGFIDKDNIGVQGHSWGGYQIAYLVTKTDIFKAAESGAPVPNMISAYGGIRWWTGLSRQFQYEHTQSRIGGTPWEYPARYVENSPIFNIDKINTPLLIMHNDEDGHVPWYQGIEFFVALRRLQKPSWFLNYNGEPHWPLKRQNRKDFNVRMAQFFDHYLKGAPKPVWMERGVPALEKGINQGLELTDSK
ncbi:alpha/beta hydrolase family protein [Algoriphagus sediminis]|uniref:Prolyl oligopeptidase family serine peptidase n=1 Tax=Algoriphagus sediminis TaxID=3057113 RepID=A0ABT7YH65_9BACT|nr:prolyl oligopeptidase family serine peptidase [Algoriphagus sediminis]MDN3205876.1 prolyl oligopeptidase family serine peptidase [Algoriphagus sediminis]